MPEVPICFEKGVRRKEWAKTVGDNFVRSCRNACYLCFIKRSRRTKELIEYECTCCFFLL